MQAIYDFLQSFTDAIISVFQFLVGIIEDLVYFLSVLGWALAQIPSLLGWLPSSLLATVTILITIVIVCRVIGRG